MQSIAGTTLGALVVGQRVRVDDALAVDLAHERQPHRAAVLPGARGDDLAAARPEGAAETAGGRAAAGRTDQLRRAVAGLLGTTTTGHGAWWTTCVATDPVSR